MKFIPFSRYKIVGHSMEPAFQEGEVVWVNNWAYLFKKPKIGDVVILSFGSKKIIKRIVDVRKSGVYVSGDNQVDSLDSRTLGEIKLNRLIGKV